MDNKENKKNYGELIKQITALSMSPLVFGRVKTSLENISKMLRTAEDVKYQDLMKWVVAEMEHAKAPETKNIWGKVMSLIQEYFKEKE